MEVEATVSNHCMKRMLTIPYASKCPHDQSPITNPLPRGVWDFQWETATSRAPSSRLVSHKVDTNIQYRENISSALISRMPCATRAGAGLNWRQTPLRVGAMTLITGYDGY